MESTLIYSCSVEGLQKLLENIRDERSRFMAESRIALFEEYRQKSNKSYEELGTSEAELNDICVQSRESQAWYYIELHAVWCVNVVSSQRQVVRKMLCSLIQELVDQGVAISIPE